MQIQKPKGTLDLYGEQGARFIEIQEVARSIAEKYNCGFIKTPTFERSELFHRGIGEGSDIVRKETYDFVDKGGRDMTLKPEGTAGVVRAFIENKLYVENRLAKFYYFSPAFRYERPQDGRYREHTQFGVEMFGSSSPLMDIELISLAYSFYKMLGIDVKLRLNTLGDKESRDKYRDALKDYFTPNIGELCDDCKERLEKNPLRILDCKYDAEHSVLKNAPLNTEYLNDESKKFFEEVKKGVEVLGIDFEVDSRLVRGIDYYSHTIFEFIYMEKANNHAGVVGAGGRYDSLIEELGGPSTPALGFGLGLERIATILEEKEIELNEDKGVDAYIYAFEGLRGKQFKLAYNLRMNGFKVDTYYEPLNIKNAFKEADKASAKYILILGDEELKENKIIVKNNTNQEQELVDIDSIVEYLDSHI